MSDQHKVAFSSLVTGSAFSFDADGRVMVKVAVDTGAELIDGPATDSVVTAVASSRLVYRRKVIPRDGGQGSVRWSNGCNQSVPAALRYLANHDRPSGGESRFNGMHLMQLADEIESMAKRELYEVPPAYVSRGKFLGLVEHCKFSDKRIAELTSQLNTVHLYGLKEVWYWEGSEEDHLESLTCPVVINAEDLRELLKSAVAAVLPAAAPDPVKAEVAAVSPSAEAMPVDGQVSASLEADSYTIAVKSVLRLNDDGLWANFELNGKHVAINLDYVGPAKAFCAEFRAEYAPKPKCDGNHGGPRCADPECWNDDQPGVVVRSGVINSVSDFSEVDALMTPWPVAVARDGVGLPPVGIHCEYGAASEFDPIPLNLWLEGDKIKCVAHIEIKGASPLPLFWNERTFSASTVAAHCYRPIRTPEQIAAEERIKAAQEWLKGVGREYGLEAAKKCGDILVAAEAKRVAK